MRICNLLARLVGLHEFSLESLRFAEGSVLHSPYGGSISMLHETSTICTVSKDTSRKTVKSEESVQTKPESHWKRGMCFTSGPQSQNLSSREV